MLGVLRFEPRYRNYLWGGRRLETILGKVLDDGEHFAESWEVVDHGQDQSVVRAGPWAGWTLGRLCQEHGQLMFGRHAPQPHFPLLFKYLDCQQNLSVQVHPNDQQAALLDPPDLGKTEAWVVVHADPGARIYAGLKQGFDRAALAREARRGTAHLCLHSFEPRVGDCVFIPAGVVHALGAGLVIAEIQQASDTTYRLYDWNRTGPDGKPRPLHIEQALEVVDDRYGPVQPQQPQPLTRNAEPTSRSERLVQCDKFVLDRHRATEPLALGGDDRFHIITLLEGELMLNDDAPPLRKGETALLPACLQLTAIPRMPCEILEMYLP